MGRLDIKTLVLAFEKKIEALEKNPPDQVPMSVIFNLLDIAVDDVIKQHFVHEINLEIRQLIKNEFRSRHEDFVKNAIQKIFDDPQFITNIEERLKSRICHAIESI